MAILDPSRKLKKELSLFNVYTIATGATISSGFFLLPGLAAAAAGPAVVFSYILAIVPLLPGILSVIELATAMPRAGGVYYFLDRSMGPMIGTIGGIGTWAALMLKTAFALVGIGAYLGLFFPEMNMQVVAIGLALLLGLINLYGARKSSSVQTVLVLGLLVLLAWFCAKGVGHVEWAHFDDFMGAGWANIFAAAGIVCVSYMGITKVASVAEEVKNPERNLPLGIFFAMATTAVVYVVGTFVMVGVLPPDKLNGNLTPVATTAEVLVGHWGAIVMTVAAVLAFVSVANAGILSSSRYPLAMSRDHLFSKTFRRLNRHRTPVNGVLVTVAIILVFVMVFDPTKIAKLASAFQLMLFAFISLAVIVMRESRIESYDPGYRTPWYPWLQVFGIIAPFALIIVMGWLPILFTLGLIALGAVWYFYYGRRRVTRGGAIYHLFARLGTQRFEGLDRELRSILKEKGLRSDDPYDEIVARADVLEQSSQDSFEQVVQNASELMAVHVPASAEQLAVNFMGGTRVGATPVSKGVALPHLRMADLSQPRLVLARVRAGVHVEVNVDFVDHAKEQAIYAVIFLISPDHDAAQHLRILAQLAQHVDDERFMEDWLAATSDQSLKEILLREDRFLSLLIESDAPSGALAGQMLRNLPLPDDSLIAIIHRSGRMLVPDGNTSLQVGDRLTIVGLPEAINLLRSKYRGGG